MILSNLKNIDLDKKTMPAIIAEALDYLFNTDFSHVTNGRQSLRADNKMFAVVSEYQTLPKEERKGEIHRKFIDIHFVASGQEIIGTSLSATGHVVCQEYDSEGDALLYSQINEEIEVVLLPGNYAVFFPNEIHRPGCSYQKAMGVKKVVIKIDISLI